MKKKYIIWVIIIAAVVGAVFYFRSGKTKTEYTVSDVVKGNVVQTVSVTGDLVSKNQVDLAFKTSGRLRTINVDVSDEVKKGQLLGSIEPGVLNAELKQAQEQVKYQKKTLENMKERDDTYNSEQRDAQRAQVRTAEENVNAILAQFGDLRIFSPINGVVLKRNADPGEIVSITNPVFSVGDPENLIIESNIPESDIIKISVGQKASVTFDALALDDKFEGEVMEIEPAATVIQDVVYYKTKLKLITKDARLKNGMSADIDIKAAEKNDVLAIPARAIKTENNKKYAEVLIDAEKNITERANIQTGLEGDEGMVEVIFGLKEGQKVVTFVKVQ